MLFNEILISIIIGIIAGIFTGLTPGVHINLVAILLLSVSGFLLNFFSPVTLASFIISMAVVHTFLDAIPSVFLGAPDADQVLNVLPGHKLLLRGQGYEAVKLTVIGSLLCLLLTIILIPLMIPITPIIFEMIDPYMGWILLVVWSFMILKERSFNKKTWAFIVFLSSGILGIIVLTMPNLDQPLLPLLSGMFGISTLITSLSNNIKIPKQLITEHITVPKKQLAKVLSAGIFSGGLTGLFPGLGSAQAAIIGSQLTGDVGDYAFMIMVGGINTVNFLFSLVTYYTLEKARNGAVVVIMEILKDINLNILAIFLSVALIAGCIATFLALGITRIFSKLINKINYRYLCISIIIFVSALVLYFSGFVGILILIISTCVGIVPTSVGVGRNHAMGCLLLPVTLFFLL